MMYPILCKVRYESLHMLFAHRDLWKQISFSVLINWIIAPFLMVRSLQVKLTRIARLQLIASSASLGPFFQINPSSGSG